MEKDLTRFREKMAYNNLPESFLNIEKTVSLFSEYYKCEENCKNLAFFTNISQNEYII